MQEISLRITVDGSGNLVIDQTTGKIRQMAATSVKASSDMEAAFSRVKGVIATMVSAAVIGKMGSEVVELEEKLGAIARQGNLASGEIESLKQHVFDISKATHIGIDPLLDGIAKVMAKTGDLSLAVNNLYAIGTAASASGAQVEDIAAIVADLSSKFGILDKDMAKALDILYVQGKTGAFELKDMATQAERLTAAAAMLNLKGIEGMRVMGGVVQLIRQATGSAEEATTSFENLARELVENHEKIKKVADVMVFDENMNPRRLDKVVEEIVTNVDGQVDKLMEIFSGRAMRAVNAFAISYKKFGDFRELDAFIKAGGDMAQTLEDAAKREEEFSARMVNLKTTLLEVADAFAPVIDGVGKVLVFVTKTALMAAAGIVEAARAWEVFGTKVGLTESVRRDHQVNAEALAMMRDDIYKVIDGLDAKTGDYGKTVLQAQKAVDGARQSEIARADAMRKNVELTEKQIELNKKAEDAFDKYMWSAKDVSERDKAIHDLMEDARQTAEVMVAAGKDPQPVYDELVRRIGLVGEEFKKTADEAEAMRKATVEALISDIKGMGGTDTSNLSLREQKDAALLAYDERFFQMMQEKTAKIKLTEDEELKIIEAYEQAKLAILKKYDELMKQEKQSLYKSMLEYAQQITGIQQDELRKMALEDEIAKAGQWLDWYNSQTVEFQDKHYEEYKQILKRYEDMNDTLEDGKYAFDAVSSAADNTASAVDKVGAAGVSAAGALSRGFQNAADSITNSMNQVLQVGMSVFGPEWDAWVNGTGPAPEHVPYIGDANALPLPSYATGLDYVTNDMVVKVHEKEAILNPYEAEQWRSGSGGVSIGEININLPTGARTDTGEDWRRIVREHIIPEIAAAAR